jgi:hypothetical protein
VEDADGSRFVDSPAVAQWLQGLTYNYLIHTQSQPRAGANTVIWTERLIPRGISYQHATGSSVTVDVHAVIQDGKIALLSGAYPAIPQLSAASPAEHTVVDQPSSGSAMPSPGVLFVLAALGLAASAVLASRFGSALLLRKTAPAASPGRGEHIGQPD